MIKRSKLALGLMNLFFKINNIAAQNNIDPGAFYNEVKIYVNPVLPGDYPNVTMIKISNDFSHCGSSFHFYLYTKKLIQEKTYSIKTICPVNI